VFLAAPTSTDRRLKRISEVSSGFVYAVSRTGVTGARKEVAEDAQNLVRRLRRYTKLPIAVGFGISTPEQFVAVASMPMRRLWQCDCRDDRAEPGERSGECGRIREAALGCQPSAIREEGVRLKN